MQLNERPGDPGRTLGVVGLILSVVVSAAGLVVSAVALGRSRRAGHRNSPALAGVIVGTALTGLGALVSVGAVLAVTTAGLTGAIGAVSALGHDGGVEVPTPSPTGTLPSETFGGAPLEYAVGDCFLEPTPDYGHVKFVDCAEPHDYEVYTEFELPDTVDGAYPGDERMTVAAEDGCYEEFEAFIGVPYEESAYDLAYISPDRSTWTGYDDRQVVCVAVDPAGSHTGSLEGIGE